MTALSNFLETMLELTFLHHPFSSLNLTYGWGCESGDSFGDGTFDGGASTNTPDDVYPWNVYSAVGSHTAALNQSATVPGGTATTGTTVPYHGWDSTWNQCDQDIYPYNARAEELAAPAVPVDSQKSTRASPGHLIMAAHACTFGAVAATVAVLKGEQEEGMGWADTFRLEASKAAAAVSPVGGYVVAQHVCGGQQHE
uniref:Uncharacterized protein n=1 Tax=Hemiselmis andersenii TaxID=464988 RepID=A0A7S1H7V1_HEMAN